LLNYTLMGTGVGAMFSEPFRGLSVILAAYGIWNIVNLKAIDDWLATTNKDGNSQPKPPNTKGIWLEIFDHLYRYQKRAIASRRELQALIDRGHASVGALKEGVLITDQNGNLEFWNDALGNIMGFRFPEDKGLPLTNLFRDPRLKAYFDSKNYEEALIVPSPVNEQHTLEIQITLFGKDERVLVVRDVSRLHNLEKMRTDFVANISHELRTPLTAMRGYLETLAEQKDAPAELVNKATNNMLEQSDRMEALVNDLLMLARLETKEQARTENVAVHSLLKSICEDVQRDVLKQQQSLSLISAEPLQLRGTEQELHSAFSNLINNAIKYAGARTEIKVRWWEDEEGAHLQVGDNGKGIAPEHLPRLTERFYRVDQSRLTTTGGTGLGLAIVKHVKMRHGGSLEINSEFNKGSLFTCHFPKATVHYQNETQDKSPLQLLQFPQGKDSKASNKGSSD